MTTPFDTPHDSPQDAEILNSIPSHEDDEYPPFPLPMDEDDVDFLDDDTFDNDFEGDFVEDEEEDDYEEDIISSMFPNDEDREDW